MRHYPIRALLRFQALCGAIVLFQALSLGEDAAAQTTTRPAFENSAADFTSSNLPILVIDTEGEAIVDDPKTRARLGVIDNGEGARNNVTDAHNGYDGYIGIEIRGSSSQMFPKKSFGFETWDETGEDIDVSLLGMPEEADWVLYAPYSDKSLMRNVLTFHLANHMGRYASRTRFCELVLNGVYQGVYVLMEKVKRDDNRLDIAKLDEDEISGDDLTGGYIVKIDKTTGSDIGGWHSAYGPTGTSQDPIYYQYDEPKASDIVPEQAAYIQEFIGRFEDVMASHYFSDAGAGYPSILDVEAAVDYFLLTEISRNVDGYRLSAFMYKDKDSNGGKLVMGPAWDYNLAFGNADYYNGAVPAGLHVKYPISGDDFPIPFWWPKLLQDEAFARAARDRWTELREDVLNTDEMTAYIDSTAGVLAEAQARNFEAWPVLGEYVWPNAFVGGTYAEEVDYLKSWITQRSTWLDGYFANPGSNPEGPLAESAVFEAAYPNPAYETATITFSTAQTLDVQLDLYTLLGQRVRTLYRGAAPAGEPVTVQVDATALASGTYMAVLTGTGVAASRQIVVVR